ncbi:MAG: segregation/condensation protein A [Coriobacteriales bacterium]|jgi:segregation and condensation protein A|nr:segregation/condensation protein A [Coriobacteriales bacterium]
MSYNVRTAEFEGPFQLLLHLVTQRRVDIGNISITSVADQYLAYLDTLRELDMDVASDFIEVAASLLALKAASLLPEVPEGEPDEDWEELPPAQARELLLSRLIAYKQFKNAAAALGVRMRTEGRMHPRHAALESRFLQVLPDYLKGMSLEKLAAICARLASRREVFLLQARHIAARPIPVEARIAEISQRLVSRPHTTFEELLDGDREAVFVVVTFLAVLELYHRGLIDMRQAEPTAVIQIDWTGKSYQAAAQSATSNISTDTSSSSPPHQEEEQATISNIGSRA